MIVRLNLLATSIIASAYCTIEKCNSETALT